jgi:hypothetical protein
MDVEWDDVSVKGGRAERMILHREAIVCANDACRELSLSVKLAEGRVDYGGSRPVVRIGKTIGEWRLLPPSFAKPQPDYVPAPLSDDYYEACAIRDLSPKASATLTRRCLQGMIRDFCGISRRRLVDEIEELRTQVDQGNAPRGVQHDTVDAIDHVRGIGNIGAHMEADINVIVDVDPNEAQKLIELVELLFKEWYVARHERQQRLAGIGMVAEEKKLLKEQKLIAAPGAPSKSHKSPGSD